MLFKQAAESWIEPPRDLLGNERLLFLYRVVCASVFGNCTVHIWREEGRGDPCLNSEIGYGVFVCV